MTLPELRKEKTDIELSEEKLISERDALMMKLNVQHDVSAKIDLFKETCYKFLSKINDPKIVTERLKKDIIKLLIDEVVIEGESVKIFATIPLPNKFHEREMDKTDIPGTFNAGATLGPVNETNMARIWNKHKQTNTPLKRKVFVAMSGGVDSSVAAALLKSKGFHVVGVFMKPWQPEEVNSKQFTSCLWKQDREDAMKVASVLGVKFLTWDFSKEYKKSVVDYMVGEYKFGRTPNPDVMCNKEIKFGLFFKKAVKEGANFIATGHYIALKNRKVYIAKDKNKDQSYFLWILNKQIISKCLFPLGDYTKPEVRKLAQKFNLLNHDKKDSQGVCFIGPLEMKNFLKTKINSKTGKIIHVDGRILGEHDGVYYYTIGQRHGLNINIGGGPYYVVSKDVKRNIIHVGTENNLRSSETKIDKISWVSKKIKLPAKVFVRLRYRASLKKAVLGINGILKLKNFDRAVASGQSAVFYGKDGEMLGGGIIK